MSDAEQIDRHMLNTDDWHQIPCYEREAILKNTAGLHVFSSLTDLDGEFGTAIVYTEWGISNPDRATLRDYRWPNSERTCEHWVPDDENGELR